MSQGGGWLGQLARHPGTTRASSKRRSTPRGRLGRAPAPTAAAAGTPAAVFASPAPFAAAATLDAALLGWGPVAERDQRLLVRAAAVALLRHAVQPRGPGRDLGWLPALLDGKRDLETASTQALFRVVKKSSSIQPVKQGAASCPLGATCLLLALLGHSAVFLAPGGGSPAESALLEPLWGLVGNLLPAALAEQQQQSDAGQLGQRSQGRGRGLPVLPLELLRSVLLHDLSQPPVAVQLT